MEQDVTSGQETVSEPSEQTPSPPPQDDLGIGSPPDQNSYQDFADYMKDEAAYQARRVVAQRDREALRPAPPPFPESAELRKEMAEEGKRQAEWRDITLLGEDSLRTHPIWQTREAQTDFSDKLTKFNLENDKGLVILPAEESAWGPVKKINPGDTVAVQVPQDILRGMQQNYQGMRRADETPFQTWWGMLRRAGFAERARPSIVYPEELKKEAEAREPKRTAEDPFGSQREYTKWAEKRGMKRF